MSFHSSSERQSLDGMNELPKRIFEWICNTFNIGGYAPHIYECDEQGMRFVIRRINGTRCDMSFQNQIKISAVGNHMFRVKQRSWPIKVDRDVIEGQYLEFWDINITGKERVPGVAIEMDEDLTDDGFHHIVSS